MWKLDCEESWAPKNWCFWTVVLEKTLESPLDCKEIQPVHFKGDQSWVFFGRTDAKAETPVLWSPHTKSWLIGKDSDAGRDWGQEEKRTTEDEMAGWRHRLDGHEFEWTPEVGDGQGGLECCNSWGCKESDTTEWLNWLTLSKVITSLDLILHFFSLSDVYMYFTQIYSCIFPLTRKTFELDSSHVILVSQAHMTLAEIKSPTRWSLISLAILSDHLIVNLQKLNDWRHLASCSAHICWASLMGEYSDPGLEHGLMRISRHTLL